MTLGKLSLFRTKQGTQHSATVNRAQARLGWRIRSKAWVSLSSLLYP